VKKLVLLTMAMIAFAAAAKAETFLFSNTVDIQLGGVTYQEGDLIEYNMDTGAASLFFDADTWFQAADVDAVHVLPNGNVILSMENDETYDEVDYENGDLIEFNPVNGDASLYFPGGVLLGGAENIDAMSLTPSGNLILSTTTSATLAGVGFARGDLVEYNPVTEVAELLFEGSSLFVTTQVHATCELSSLEL